MEAYIYSALHSTNGRNCVEETMMYPRSPDKNAVPFNI